MTALTERLQRLYVKYEEPQYPCWGDACNELHALLPEVIAALEACERDRQEWIEIPRLD